MSSDWGSIPPPLALGLRTTDALGDADDRLLFWLIFVLLILLLLLLLEVGAKTLGRRCGNPRLALTLSCISCNDVGSTSMLWYGGALVVVLALFIVLVLLEVYDDGGRLERGLTLLPFPPMILLKGWLWGGGT